MNIIGIIPARYASTRLPAKPLAKIGSKTMIEWTYFHSKKAKSLSDVIVATDHEDIYKVIKNAGGNVVMTDPNHATGTDRLIEVVSGLSGVDVVVNIQGDEPGIEPELIDGVVALKIKNRNWEMTTAACLMPASDQSDPNRVKVVFDKNQKALYFSRSLIPSNHKKITPVYRHLGIYSYEREFLLNYNNLPQSELEASESLEQLRAVEAGHSIGIYLTDKAGLSVDSPEDLEIVIKDFKERGLI
ncbi:MAG: 3-deoxy-manno-octulosonate cytidylyltransferase [Leptospiraceae bacterium]|nr:3-deoxy-manno-octulosonate cytidylyltransferase [Leptospiraceae bacterium]MBK7053933.1 3-deoxy-manno-octulosonate cytidylyltransferase [Leptospiraceae bacterium]MBK9499946.1 3-deoxy-manno-octulosonate cytidylyltransferase [Leptospiraceae bacterium]MBL0263542.1 3-deoxy-manno-octulosonate cytidylyltransferase [Leptospiraceae bacterium]MBP9165620.1 3-deoxy-manno-octulosonate cytidylyltransferase [Leptospiraceae bacterium]